MRSEDYPKERMGGLRKTFLTKSHPHRRKKEKPKRVGSRGKRVQQNHSKRRIVIENTIYRMKRNRIMGDIFRNRLRKHDKVSYIASGLVNYRALSPL